MASLRMAACVMSPIRAENRARYPKDWRAIADGIRERAGLRCECAGECGREHSDIYLDDARCPAVHGCAHPITESRVVLTVAHLDHTPENCDPDNLKAMCQRCHLSYDATHHASNAARTRAARATAGMDALFGDDVA